MTPADVRAEVTRLQKRLKCCCSGSRISPSPRRSMAKCASSEAQVLTELFGNGDPAFFINLRGHQVFERHLLSRHCQDLDRQYPTQG